MGRKMGFSEQQNLDWEQMFLLLQKYSKDKDKEKINKKRFKKLIKKKKDCIYNYPKKEEEYQGAALGAWLFTQINLEKSGRLDSDRRARLASIGFLKSAPYLHSKARSKTLKKNRNKRETVKGEVIHYKPDDDLLDTFLNDPELNFKDETLALAEKNWRYKCFLASYCFIVINKLKETDEEDKDAEVKYKHVGRNDVIYVDGQRINIGRWLALQRHLISTGNISEQRKRILEQELFIHLYTREDKWNRFYKGYKDYVKENYELPKYNTTYEILRERYGLKTDNLGRWWSKQKRQISICSIPFLRYLKLETWATPRIHTEVPLYQWLFYYTVKEKRATVYGFDFSVVAENEDSLREKLVIEISNEILAKVLSGETFEKIKQLAAYTKKEGVVEPPIKIDIVDFVKTHFEEIREMFGKDQAEIQELLFYNK